MLVRTSNPKIPIVERTCWTFTNPYSNMVESALKFGKFKSSVFRGFHTEHVWFWFCEGSAGLIFEIFYDVSNLPNFEKTEHFLFGIPEKPNFWTQGTRSVFPKVCSLSWKVCFLGNPYRTCSSSVLSRFNVQYFWVRIEPTFKKLNSRKNWTCPWTCSSSTQH